MKIERFFALYLTTTLIYSIHSTIFTIKNNCKHEITPSIFSNFGKPVTSAFERGPRASNTVNISGSWSVLVWAGYGCSNDGGKFSCESEDCGSGQVECNCARGAPPATPAEFSISNAYAKELYDVSNDDGSNLHVSIVPQGGGSASITDCSANINAKCPSELAAKDGSDETIGCKSACLAFGKYAYYCRGKQGLPCPPTKYSKFFKGLCPKAIIHPYDVIPSTFICDTGVNYVIIFCP